MKIYTTKTFVMSYALGLTGIVSSEKRLNGIWPNTYVDDFMGYYILGSSINYQFANIDYVDKVTKQVEMFL